MIEIKNRFTGAVILSGDFETMVELIKANPSADLSSADLSSTDLRYANLRYANLSSADLRYANLRYANLLESKSGDLFIDKIYSIGPIGSRSDYLQVWTFTDGTVQYKTGCYSGSEDDFSKRVEAHLTDKHRIDYLNAIQFVKALRGSK